MASDIGPQSPSTPNCLCRCSKLNHLSSHTLQVLTGLSNDRRPGLHRSTGTRRYRAIAAAATLIEKNFKNRNREDCCQKRGVERAWLLPVKAFFCGNFLVGAFSSSPRDAGVVRGPGREASSQRFKAAPRGYG